MHVHCLYLLLSPGCKIFSFFLFCSYWYFHDLFDVIFFFFLNFKKIVIIVYFCGFRWIEDGVTCFLQLLCFHFQVVISSWYNCNGWLGVKHQVSYFLQVAINGLPTRLFFPLVSFLQQSNLCVFRWWSMKMDLWPTGLCPTLARWSRMWLETVSGCSLVDFVSVSQSFKLFKLPYWVCEWACTWVDFFFVTVFWIFVCCAVWRNSTWNSALLLLLNNQTVGFVVMTTPDQFHGLVI